jgi:inosine-uridine nucleoside N-ribohydrolase
MIELIFDCDITMGIHGKSDIPARRGAPRPKESEDRTTKQRESPAARFLAETARNNPGRVTVLATGSPTNLLGAYRIDPLPFANLKEIVLMGGVIEPLIINGDESTCLQAHSIQRITGVLFSLPGAGRQ